MIRSDLNRISEETPESADSLSATDGESRDQGKEKKAAEAEASSLDAQLDRLFPLMDLMEEAVMVVDANSRKILRANAAALRMTDYPSQELIGLKLDELHDPEELPLLLLEIQRLEFEPVTKVENFSLIQRNGWKVPVDIQLARALPENSEFAPPHFVAVYRGRIEGEWDYSAAKRNEELLALMEVGQTIASALDLEEIIDLTMLKLAGVCGAKYAAIFLREPDGQLRMFKAHKNPPEDVLLFDRPWRVGIEEGPFYEVNEKQKILQVENVFTDPRFQKWRPIAERIGYGSMISLALIPRDRALGVFNLYYEKPRKFSQEEINFLRTAVTYLAISIENARLYREYKEKADQIAAISQITNSINSSLDLEEIIKTVSTEVKKLVDFDYISIVLFEEDTEKLNVFSMASEELGRRLGEDYWRRLDDSSIGWVLLSPDSPRGVQVTQREEDPLYETKLRIERELKSKMNVLLLSKDKYLGTFSIGKMEPKAYTATHQVIFRQVAGQVATALENAKLYQEARRRLTEFSALADVSKTISSSLNIREVLDLIVKAAATAMHAKLSTIWIVGEGVPSGRYSSNGGSASAALQSTLHAKLEQVIREKKPLIIENLEGEEEMLQLPEALKGAHLRSYLGVPVISRGKTIAVLSVYKENYHRFDEREIKLLSTIANQAAIAIENARLYERERRRAAQLAMVNEVAKKITSTLDLNKLLNTVTSAIKEIFDYHLVGTYLVDSGSNKVVLKAVSGETSPELEAGVYLQNADSPVALSIRRAETVLIQDLSDAEALEPGFPSKGSLLSIPLRMADRVDGALVLISRRKNAFDRRDLYAFEVLASQISSAIQNAHLYEEAVTNAEKLAQANEELERFVFTVSHDLKSPIVSVQGFASILLNDFGSKLDEEGLHYLQRIQSNAKQMERLIHDLLELSRVGRVVNPFEPVDFNELVELVVADFQFQAQEKGVTIEYAKDFPTVVCDRDRIVQVFSNLISNAIKYMGDTPEPRIEIGHFERDDDFVFYVKDNGIGIDPRYHKKIFDLFQSLKEIKDVEGTGVGLTIVKRIVENHKGKVWVESQKGKGATFYFTIPKQDLKQAG